MTTRRKRASASNGQLWHREILMRNTTLTFHFTTQGLRSALRALLRNKKGQDLIEYALVVALIAFAAAAGMSTVATKINAAFTSIGTKLATYSS